MESNQNIILLTIAGTAVMLFLVLVIVIFVINYGKRMSEKDAKHKMAIKEKELEMLKAIINSQEEQREKIGKNLHDEVGPLLSTVKLHLSSFKRKLKKETLEVEDFDKENAFLDDIIKNVRSASHELTPHFLLKFGLVKAIDNFTSAIESPQFSVSSSIDDTILEKFQLINLYRILLEVINNIIKHDQCTQGTISFSLEENIIKIEVIHNGNGITNEDFNTFVKESSGIGLSNLKSRLILLNGDLDYVKSDYKIGAIIKVPLA